MSILALLIILGAVVLMVRGVEVRLVLIGAALLIASLAADPLAVIDKFRSGMIDEVVIPICAAMGFAAVLRATECDRHLSSLLLVPARRYRVLLVPFGILAAFCVNIALPSQTSTAASVGPVLIPLLFAAGLTPALAGTTLLIGASFGGDLLSPVAQDTIVMARAANMASDLFTARMALPCLVGVIVAMVTFCIRYRHALKPRVTDTIVAENDATPHTHIKAKLHKAIIPFVPLALIILTSPKLGLFPFIAQRYGAQGLPVLHAMLIGSSLAALTSWRQSGVASKTFFTGMGDGYGSVVSLTIAARCFGMAIGISGVSQSILSVMGGEPWLMRASALLFPGGLALLSGSASGPVAAFAETIVAHLPHDVHTVVLGSLACLAGSIGRTLSPVAAVVVYTSSLVGIKTGDLVRHAALPVLIGACVSATLIVLF